jgi:hypothetical protein
VITVPTENTIDFAPGAILQIKFQFLSEETLNIRCKLKWSCKTPPHGLTQKMGMEIIDLWVGLFARMLPDLDFLYFFLFYKNISLTFFDECFFELND